MQFLLNVGAEKSGTTWLHNYFKEHPQFHDIGKELNAIQRDDLVPSFAPDFGYRACISAYFSHISKLNKTTGDFTHYEGSTENVYRLLKSGLGQYDIDVVPVYIMRDPIKRAWSAWNMLAGGYDFDMPPPAFQLTVNYLQCKYKETIEALDNVFSNPLYFFYEDFFRQEHVDLICNELEIPNHPVNNTPINKGSYDSEVPEDFVTKFCMTSKTRDAVHFVFERFSNAPWNIEDYTKFEVKA
tara:strand:+ start:5781 stop:6503 length:723 start_codon:yes stop_codon:yes gene_type:complete